RARRQARRRRLRDPRALLRPVAAARVEAVAAAHAAVGGREPVPGADRIDPGPRARGHVSLLVHRRLPRGRRDRPDTAPRPPGSPGRSHPPLSPPLPGPTSRPPDVATGSLGKPAAPVGFGPSALATPANAVTVARLLATPALLALLLQRPDSWVALSLWVVL